MTWEFNPSSTPQQVSKYEDEDSNNSKQFVRDDSDNKLFPEIQVKDIRDIITEDCVGHYDADTMIWKACANMQNSSIVVKHKTEGWEEELSNVTAFKGRGKSISKDSWLGMKNLEREVEGLPQYTLEDFEVEDKYTLKMDKDKAIEQAKIQIHLKMKQVRNQFRIPKIKLHIGEGECFRHSLDLVRPYKGNRKEASRPIILKDIRDWVKKDLNAEVAKQGYEADDRVEHMGYQGYVNWVKTGKFNHIVIASDKDAKNNPKLLADPDTYVGEDNPLKGKFKFPQGMLIKDSQKDCGDIGIVTKKNGADYKFYGFKGLLWQAFCSGDQADNYNCLSHLGMNLGFGDDSAYKLLKPCKTAKEALQAVIDKFAELLPYGVQYTSHKDLELDVDTMEYMNTYFKVAYMTRSYQDTMDFYKLCKAFKVDTSKVVGNNKLTPPVRKYVGSEDHVKELQNLLQNIIKQDMKGIKSMKKADQVPVLDGIKEKLSNIDFDSHYKMVQINKETEEEVEYEG